jgi:Transcriptional regulators
MATLQDIAKRAGVVVSTVSRALNGNPEIKKDTREKIIQIAREMNYISNKKELEFCRSTLKTIGVICPEIKSNFYAGIVNTMGEAIKDAGYTMIVGLTNFKYVFELHYLNLFEEKKVDGIVLITSMDEKLKDDLVKFKSRCIIPVVQLASFISVEEFDCIKIDERLAVNLALEHLIELGHEDIAFIGEIMTKDRQKHFMDALDKHDIKIDNNSIIMCEERFEVAGYSGMKDILSNSRRIPTAVFTTYDDIAIGAMKAIFESGLRISEDISVIGIDNVCSAPYLYRSLTTVSSPINEMTNIAIKILLSKIEDKNNKIIQHVVVKPELIIRETTSRANKQDRM